MQILFSLLNTLTRNKIIDSNMHIRNTVRIIAYNRRVFDQCCLSVKKTRRVAGGGSSRSNDPTERRHHVECYSIAMLPNAFLQRLKGTCDSLSYNEIRKTSVRTVLDKLDQTLRRFVARAVQGMRISFCIFNFYYTVILMFLLRTCLAVLDLARLSRNCARSFGDRWTLWVLRLMTYDQKHNRSVVFCALFRLVNIFPSKSAVGSVEVSRFSVCKRSEIAMESVYVRKSERVCSLFDILFNTVKLKRNVCVVLI